MSSILLTYKESKKNRLYQNSNSNRNLFSKKDNNSKEELIIHYEKNNFKRNILKTNTSVKKLKQVKKININDSAKKTMKKNTSMRNKKICDSSNKENYRINQNEKYYTQKSSQKKILKNIVNATKYEIKKNLPIMKRNPKNNVNKLKMNLINSDYISEIFIKKNKDENSSNLYKSDKSLKSKENNNNSIIVTQKKINIRNIKYDNNNDLKSDFIEKNEDYENNINSIKKNLSQKNKKIKIENELKELAPFIKMKKEHIKYSIERKKKSNPNKIKKKYINEDDCLYNLDKDYFMKYNSINNERGNYRSYIDIINNFDIINIINLKEQTKKLSSTIQSQSSLNNTHELIKYRNDKYHGSMSKDYYNNKNVINLSGKLRENYIRLNMNKKLNESNDSQSVRNIFYSNKNLSLLNNEKSKDNNSSHESNNNSINQNKWDKKYFIPVVSASLISGEEINKSNKNIDNIIFNDNLNNYKNDINKKLLNFGYNNKKKREMLFNFSSKKIQNKSIKYINFNSKRTNSFIFKRNKHIKERNNSVTNMIKNNCSSNIDNDLNEQEKKLESICREISQGKLNDEKNKSNKCSISVDNINDYNYNKSNKKKEKIIEQKDKDNKINKRHKTFYFKVNSLNKIKKDNNNHNNKKISIIIKRGDLLNRLRNIKHNFSSM